MYTGKGLSEEVLKRVVKPMTAEEIWNYAVDNDLASQCSLGGKTPSRTIQAQMYVDIKEKGSNSVFSIASKKPTKFFLTSKMESIDDSGDYVPEELETNKFKESDLHPLLAYYLMSDPHFHARSKTINANTASNKIKKQNEWRYPDVVGVYYPFDDDYKPEVYELFENIKQVTVRIFSFEIKKEVSLSDVRMKYFQAISNSSWANEGYLVTAKIDEGAIEELRSLNRSFGIGLILLNLDNVSESEILFPSRYNLDLDVEMINKLSENRDFLSFLMRINKNIKARDVNKEGYDRILSDDELEVKLKAMR
jgi:hypothetical protein